MGEKHRVQLEIGKTAGNAAVSKDLDIIPILTFGFKGVKKYDSESGSGEGMPHPEEFIITIDEDTPVPDLMILAMTGEAVQNAAVRYMVGEKTVLTIKIKKLIVSYFEVMPEGDYKIGFAYTSITYDYMDSKMLPNESFIHDLKISYEKDN